MGIRGIDLAQTDRQTDFLTLSVENRESIREACAQASLIVITHQFKKTQETLDMKYEPREGRSYV
jgi:hypothetical protein